MGTSGGNKSNLFRYGGHAALKKFREGAAIDKRTKLNNQNR